MEIYLIDIDGQNEMRLTVSNETFIAGFSWQPAWSPDGSMIVFNSDQDGPGEIYAINADGSGVRRVSFTEPSSAFSAAPQWSPVAVGGGPGAPIPVRIGALMRTDIPEFPNSAARSHSSEHNFGSETCGQCLCGQTINESREPHRS